MPERGLGRAMLLNYFVQVVKLGVRWHHFVPISVRSPDTQSHTSGNAITRRQRLVLLANFSLGCPCWQVLIKRSCGVVWRSSEVSTPVERLSGCRLIHRVAMSTTSHRHRPGQQERVHAEEPLNGKTETALSRLGMPLLNYGSLSQRSVRSADWCMLRCVRVAVGCELCAIDQSATNGHNYRRRHLQLVDVARGYDIEKLISRRVQVPTLGESTRGGSTKSRH